MVAGVKASYQRLEEEHKRMEVVRRREERLQRQIEEERERAVQQLKTATQQAKEELDRVARQPPPARAWSGATVLSRPQPAAQTGTAYSPLPDAEPVAEKGAYDGWYQASDGYYYPVEQSEERLAQAGAKLRQQQLHLVGRP